MATISKGLTQAYELQDFAYAIACAMRKDMTNPTGELTKLTIMFIPKTITPRGYQVIATYDDYDYGYGRKCWSPGNDLTDRHARPNVPLRARSTLLAELLRTGKYVTGRRMKDRTSPTPKPNYTKRAKEAKHGKLLGIEIEYYPKDNRLHPENALTFVGHDGSLGSGGSEIRRLTWTSPNGRLEGLLSLKLNGRIDKSCGLHVHVDVRHLSEPLFNANLLNQAKTYERLIKLYPFLKKLVPKSRHNNQYCRWKSNCEASETFNFSGRYCAINFNSVAEHGTIEFRCQGGSINNIKIESWALLCQFLVNWCANPINTVPATWTSFIAILPEPLRSWCILRSQKLYGNLPLMDERTLSAIQD